MLTVCACFSPASAFAALVACLISSSALAEQPLPPVIKAGQVVTESGSKFSMLERSGKNEGMDYLVTFPSVEDKVLAQKIRELQSDCGPRADTGGLSGSCSTRITPVAARPGLLTLRTMVDTTYDDLTGRAFDNQFDTHFRKTSNGYVELAKSDIVNDSPACQQKVGEAMRRRAGEMGPDEPAPDASRFTAKEMFAHLQILEVERSSIAFYTQPIGRTLPDYVELKDTELGECLLLQPASAM